MRWLALAGFSIGCVGTTPPNDDGQFGEEAGARCDVVTRTPLALDEVSPLGFTAQSVLDLAEGTHPGTLTWLEAGGSSPLTLTVAQAGAIEYVEQAVVTTGTGSGEEPALSLWCPNLVSVGVDIGFVTDDGVFAEQWLGALTSDVEGQTGFDRTLEDLAGTFDPWDHIPADTDFDEVTAWLEVSFDASGPSGLIHGQGSGTDGDPNDPDSSAYAQNFDIASF